MKFYSFAAIVALVSGEPQQLFSIKSDFQGFLSKEYKTHTTKLEDTPCCLSCTAPLEKYHSVDHIFNNCGEACMDPKKFWIYKVFEPGLEKSETETPCADRKYTVYESTPTHGVWPV